MPKPSRRERRQLAEKGQSTIRPMVVPDIPLTAKPAVLSTESARPAKLTTRMQAKVAALVDAKEYMHIRGDLTRIAILAALLIGAMFALWFYLPR